MQIDIAGVEHGVDLAGRERAVGRVLQKRLLVAVDFFDVVNLGDANLIGGSADDATCAC